MSTDLCHRGCGGPAGLHVCSSVPPVPAGVGPLLRAAQARVVELESELATSQQLLREAFAREAHTDALLEKAHREIVGLRKLYEAPLEIVVGRLA